MPAPSAMPFHISTTCGVFSAMIASNSSMRLEMASIEPHSGRARCFTISAPRLM